MELTKLQKFRAYRSIALQFEKARIDKGWTLEEASEQSKEFLTFLYKLESGIGEIHKLKVGHLMKLASSYDKLVKIELVDAPKEVSKEKMM